MLFVSPLRGRKDEMERYSIQVDEFSDFSTDNLLESINFNDLFVGIDDGDSLPDLDLDEFSAGSGGEYSSEIGNTTSVFRRVLESDSTKLDNEEEGKHNLGSSLGNKEDQEVVSGSDESIVVNLVGNRRNSSKNYHVKRKVKVDWTPELHRRFVDVVEHLGVDKAFPSRILELMGVDCLTRHNIASHLQKYRSHRKHVRTQEAEAKSWSKKRHMYTASGNSGGCKREMIGRGPWVSVAQPTMGFPPMSPLHHHFRPLHVWGHPPTTNQPPVSIWPKHVLPPASLVVAPPLLTSDPSFWQAHQQRGGFTPYYFPPPSVQPPTMYEKVGVTGMQKHRTDHPATVPTTHPPVLDFHPSKESIDAVIGDVLSKPCQPLPLGLKPPALDSVMLQLYHNGLPKIPPLSLHNP